MVQLHPRIRACTRSVWWGLIILLDRDPNNLMSGPGINLVAFGSSEPGDELERACVELGRDQKCAPRAQPQGCVKNRQKSSKTHFSKKWSNLASPIRKTAPRQKREIWLMGVKNTTLKKRADCTLELVAFLDISPPPQKTPGTCRFLARKTSNLS